MEILKNERTPEYFGYVAHNCGQSIVCNPYPEKDERHSKWLNGFSDGYLVDEKTNKT